MTKKLKALNALYDQQCVISLYCESEEYTDLFRDEIFKLHGMRRMYEIFFNEPAPFTEMQILEAIREQINWEEIS